MKACIVLRNPVNFSLLMDIFLKCCCQPPALTQLISRQIAVRLRRQSSSFSTRGSVLVSQTLTTETNPNLNVRPPSLSCSNDHVFREKHSQVEVATTPSPMKATAKPKIGEFYRPASDPVIKRRMASGQVQRGRKRPVSGKLGTEERIQKHVLRNSLIVFAPDDKEIKSKSSGLINLSFYEVESAL